MHNTYCARGCTTTTQVRFGVGVRERQQVAIVVVYWCRERERGLKVQDQMEGKGVVFIGLNKWERPE